MTGPAAASGTAPGSPADFSAEGFYARGIVSWKIYLYAPYSPPKQAKRRQIAQKPPRNFVQKKFPTPPFRGAGGKVFGGLTAARPSANIRDKPRPHGPGPANRRKASRREGRERDHAKHGRAAGDRYWVSSRASPGPCSCRAGIRFSRCLSLGAVPC